MNNLSPCHGHEDEGVDGDEGGDHDEVLHQPAPGWVVIGVVR